MNRRDLLRGLAALPMASVLGSCSSKSSPAVSEPESQSRTAAAAAQPVTTLKVILDGSFALVFDRRNPTRITAFIPHDPEKMHEFYLNSLSKSVDNGQDPGHSYNFQLPSRGLEENRAKRPYTDQCFRDFSRATDVWKREKYFVTLDLPLPDVISFIPPTVPVTFKMSHRSAMMPLNHVLRYRIQDAAAIQMLREGAQPIKPARDAEFNKEVYGWCREPKTAGQKESCGQMRQYSSDWFEENAITFYFAVGHSRYQESSPKMQYHAENFFNNVLLRSFPKVQRELELEVGTVKTLDYREGQVVPAVWKPQIPQPRLLPVASIIDCRVGGANFFMP